MDDGGVAAEVLAEADVDEDDEVDGIVDCKEAREARGRCYRLKRARAG